MIDDMAKTEALVERMQAALPLRAFTTKQLRRTLEKNNKTKYPHECSVTAINYLGDEGGIAGVLDFGIADTDEVHVVSITNLRFDHKHPVAREIESYCKHRIKRIKKLHGVSSSTVW